MTNIGDQLLQPEEGWVRVDDTDLGIDYPIGNWRSTDNNSRDYNNTLTYTQSTTGNIGYKIEINVSGHGLRVIAFGATDYSQKIEVRVDGIKVGEYSNRKPFGSPGQILFFEYLGRFDKIELINLESGRMSLDAVDVLTTINKTLILSESEYKRIGVELDNKSLKRNIPVMTSKELPSGVVTASGYNNRGGNGGYAPYKAFRFDDAMGWSDTRGEGWIAYESEERIRVVAYSMRSRNTAGDMQMPYEWDFEGSEDGVDWDKIHSMSHTDWAYPKEEVFVTNNTTFYKHHRIKIYSSESGDVIGIGQIQFFDGLVSKSWETVSAILPTQAEFESEGMEDLSVLDREVQPILDSPINMSSEVLGEGKVFKGTVDLKKYFDLRKLEVK